MKVGLLMELGMWLAWMRDGPFAVLHFVIKFLHGQRSARDVRR